jgi:AcrR family transcriptional regulator
MSGRERRPRGSLNASGILDAAETLAVRGFDAVTIRAVAAEIDASPMALYRYFPTKDALVGALLDRVLSRVPEPPQSDNWIEDLRGFAFAHALVLVEHPWAASPSFTRAGSGVGASSLAERGIAVLGRGGVEGPAAKAALSGILALNAGWATLGRYAGQAEYERALEYLIDGIRAHAR